MPMNSKEKLIVRTLVVEGMLKAAAKVVTEARGKINSYLQSCSDKRHEIPNLATAYIQVNKGKTEQVPDTQKMSQDLRALIAAGRYSAAEIHELLVQGILTVGKPAELAGVIGTKQTGYVQPMTTVTTEDSDAGMYLLPQAGARWEGVKAQAQGGVDLISIVRRILDLPAETTVQPASSAQSSARPARQGQVRIGVGVMSASAGGRRTTRVEGQRSSR